MNSVQIFLSKIELRALCFVLAVAVASLAVVVMKKNDKIAAFRLDLARAYERISELEAQQASVDAALAVEDVRDVLNVVAGRADAFGAEIGKLTEDLQSLVSETTKLAKEEGGVFDSLLNNVQNLVQRFSGEVPELQKNIETLANTVESKVKNTIEKIEQPMPENVDVVDPMPEGALEASFGDNDK